MISESAVDTGFWAWWRRAVDSLAIAMTAAVVGATLVAIAWRFGPVGPAILVAIAFLPVLVLIVMADPRVAVVLVVVTFAFSSTVGSLSPLPLEAVEAAVLATATIVALVRFSRGKGPLGWAPEVAWYIAAIAWAVVALPSAADRTLAVNQVASLAGGAILMTMILGTCRTRRDVRVILGAFLAVAVVVGVLSLQTAGDVDVRFQGAVVSGRAQGPFAQPNELGGFAALALFIGVGFSLGAKRTGTRVMAALATTVVALALLLSLSRGAWIGASIGGVYLLVAVPRARRALLGGGIVLLIAALSLGAFAPQNPQVQVVGQRLVAFTAENPYDSRPAIYQEAMREIALDPWTGQGPGSFPVASARAGAETTTVFAAHAHNVWLTWGAEMGLPAAIILTLFLAAVAVAGMAARRRDAAAGAADEAAFAACLVAALLAVVGQGLVDYPWRNQVVFFAISLVIGCILAAAHRPLEERRGSETSSLIRQ